MEVLTSSGRSWGLCAGSALLTERNVTADCGDVDLDECFATLAEELHGLASKDAIFEAHAEIAEDPTLKDAVTDNIASGMPALEAVDSACSSICAMFDEIDDEYIRARKDDVKDVFARLRRIMCGPQDTGQTVPAEGDIILVADEFYPSDMESLDLSHVRGMVSAHGSTTSHVCILAKARGIPVLTGCTGCTERIRTGDRLILDGKNGKICISPDDAAEKDFIARKEEEASRGDLAARIHAAAPGLKVYANAGNVNDVRTAISNGAEGIGLFRSEFLFMDSKNGFPDEDTQFRAYREAAEICNGKTLTIRTLDIGGDKKLPYFSIPHEDNPFLGWRAIRICLERHDIFKPQLRSILRASAYGKIRIMFPMISTLEEFKDAVSVLDECKSELMEEHKAFDEDIRVGMMVETPAAVLMADSFAEVADFFSIGTNDLTQYVMAADRGNSSVSRLYRYDDPAVLKSIGMVADAAAKAGIEVAVCGEMASEEPYAATLAGLGITEVSISWNTAH